MISKPRWIVAISRGPPRPRAKRETARGISGPPFKISFIASAREGLRRKKSIESKRVSIAEGVVRGAIRRSIRRRDPPPVTVRSIAFNKLPSR